MNYTKVFTREDIEKNIPGFSDTELKRFLLSNGYGRYKNSRISKELIDKLYELSTCSYDDFLSMVAFIDCLDKNKYASVFNFATKCFRIMSNNKEEYPLMAKYYIDLAKTASLEKGCPKRLTQMKNSLKNKLQVDEIRLEKPMTAKQKKDIKIGVHTSHCCLLHGCKYGNDEECPVVKGEAKQEYLCECCSDEGIKNVDDIAAMIQLKLRKCDHCGQYYEIKEDK